MREWKKLTLLSKKNLITTALLVFACHLGIDIYTPSLPNMVKIFNSTENTLQMAITSYLLGSGLSIIFWGPLSDRFGRKPIIMMGACIVTVSATATIFCQSIHLFLLLRFIQGTGSGAAMCLGRVVAADMLNKHELAVIGATIGLITGLAPMIAPVVGGYMETYAGWQGSFAVYALLTSLALSLFFFSFTETLSEKTTHKHIIPLYKNLVSSTPFILLAMMQGMLLSILNCYAAVAPFLVQVEMHKSPVYFGLLSGFCAGCQLFTKMLFPLLIRKNHAYKIQRLGWHLLIIGSLILFSRIILPFDIVFIIGIGFSFFSIHLIFPYVFSEAYTLKHARIGTISAGLTAMGILISFLLSTIVAIIPYEGTGLLAATYFCLGITGLIVSKKVHILLDTH
jgi:Bcr/CflA subfamily drug resistance transporter